MPIFKVTRTLLSNKNYEEYIEDFEGTYSEAVSHIKKYIIGSKLDSTTAAIYRLRSFDDNMCDNIDPVFYWSPDLEEQPNWPHCNEQSQLNKGSKNCNSVKMYTYHYYGSADSDKDISGVVTVEQPITTFNYSDVRQSIIDNLGASIATICIKRLTLLNT